VAPFAGTLVDRLPHVRVMVAADLWRAALATSLIVLGDNVAVVYVLAFGLSVGAVLFNPAANSALPALVSDRELVAANSGIWTASVLSQIALARWPVSPPRSVSRPSTTSATHCSCSRPPSAGRVHGPPHTLPASEVCRNPVVTAGLQ
jgi:hypothetical protein